ncbi:MAG: hypothetical protein FJ271_01555 [Planctomycetes bacterium]|nr:hypothetical protein [Planctomycetota bacterium]
MSNVITDSWNRFLDAILPRVSAWLLSRTAPARQFPQELQFILAQPEVMEIFSLDPEDHRNSDPHDRCHGYRILGQLTVTSSGQRRKIGRSLVAGNCRTGPSFKCFDPHMGVRVERAGQRASLAACFWCGNVEVIGPAADREIYPLSGWPARLLARHLMQARIPLPEPPAYLSGAANG